MSTRVAAVDCGTNSIRLLVAEAAPQPGGFREVHRDLRLTRLGQGVDATGEFHPDALARTMAACDEYAAMLGEFGVGRVRFVATSAARDARNRDEFYAGVRARLGVDAEIISGDEEARLSFDGALSAIPDAQTPALVMDIGGGSTELVSGRPGAPLRGISLDMGSVRLRERFLFGDPPRPDEIAEASEFIDDLLDASGIDFDRQRTWIGVGGTATSLSAIVQRLDVYDRARVHGSLLARSDLAELSARLLVEPVAQVLQIPTMVPGRADVICAGALICHRVGVRMPVDLRVSEADILDGLVAALLA
ncbi:MAG: Ppx/GppA phosphatase family protein [Propioniciclava sp.]|uniref:Ppx/GppA phosphatase family protein n=1 Tax=Propioniciclava sp. TaxID=2038686 RepID=UPI0039E4168F